MSFLFDYFNQFETPNFALANPNGDLLYSLGTITDRNVKLRFNTLSEISFNAPQYTTGELNPWYDLLDYRRLIDVEDLGVFMITDIEIENDGITEYKSIVCKSREVELNFKKLSVFKGTYQFYDYITPEITLIGNLLNYIPGWTIDHIDSDLTSIYRTFDITDITLYDFLVNQASQSYQCIFKFDNINRTISAYTVANATSNSDIFLSYNNLVDKIKIKTITEELVTALNVFGGGNLSINQVNPLGTNTIYDFSFYKTTDWMSSGLISALDTWEALVESNQTTYANLLTTLKSNNSTLLTKQSELETLEGELTALQEVQIVRIRQGLSITDINTQIKAKQTEIDSKQNEIESLNATIIINISDLTEINTLLSFVENFTSDQLIELNRYIVGSTYTNPNFIQTDIMTLEEIQDQAQLLYDQAQEVLTKVSEPRYSFEVDAANFVLLEEFQTFIDQLELGCIVTVEIRNDVFASPALLGIDYSYDDPNSFKLTFSNRLRLDDSAFQFSDLFAQAINSGITTSFNSEAWSSWNKYSQNEVTTFINSALDAARNMVTSGSNQEITISAVGMRGKHILDDGSYDDKQFWFINNMLAFTRDNWDNASLAIGEIPLVSGGTAYGIAGDIILGRLIAGNELYLTNEQSTFAVSGSSATLTDGVFSLTRSDGNSKINLDPNVGIEILKRDASTSTYDRKLYIDPYGNVCFSGSLVAASGYFSGKITASSGQIGAWSIDDFGLYDIYGNYIYGNGRVRLGKLTIDGSTATFDGNIYARNLQDYVYGSQIRNINADTITAGTITGINIYGSRIAWPGVLMYSPVSGVSAISASNQMTLYSGNTGISITPTTLAVRSDSNVVIGSTLASGQVSILGSIATLDASFNQGWGWTTDIPVSNGSSISTLHFVNGILTDPYHYSYSGSSSGSTSGSSSGSSVSSMDFQKLWNERFTYGGTLPALSNPSEGIIQIGTYAYESSQLFSLFAFRLQYYGDAGLTGTFNIDIQHLSGTPLTASIDGGTGTEESWRFNSYYYFPWTTNITIDSITKNGWAFTSGSGAVSGSITLVGNMPPTGGPDLQSYEDRWLIIGSRIGGVTSTCQWKIKKIYIQPTSGSEVVLYNNP